MAKKELAILKADISNYGIEKEGYTEKLNKLIALEKTIQSKISDISSHIKIEESEDDSSESYSEHTSDNNYSQNLAEFTDSENSANRLDGEIQFQELEFKDESLNSESDDNF